MSSWPDHSLWWHLYPLGFLGAERAAPPPDEPPRHRLARLTDWLGYVVELGCNGVLLGPVFASETHGYDTVDYFRIDPRLGTEEDLVRFVRAARERGVRVVLDGVFNHVGRSFPGFADAVARGTASPFHGWFKRAGGDPAAGGGFQTFEGHDRLVELDHTDPAVADFVAEVMDYWLDRGIDGWRLDAAYRIPAEFWRRVLPPVRERHPEAWFTGEVIHGDYIDYVAQSGLDTVTQYELWKAIWSSVNDRNTFELLWALKRHNAMLESFAPQTFAGNHDVTRLASRLTEPRHLAHALVILFTVGGIPSVYAGDERAMRGVKEEREGGDDAVRPAFPDEPSGLGAEGLDCYRLHQELIGIRRRHPWLLRAQTEVKTVSNTALSYTLAHDGRRLAVALNLADEAAGLQLPEGAWQPIAGSGEFGASTVELPPSGWAIGHEPGR